MRVLYWFNEMVGLYLLKLHAVIISLQSILKMATVPTVSPVLCGMWFCSPDLLKWLANSSSATHIKTSLKITHLLWVVHYKSAVGTLT